MHRQRYTWLGLDFAQGWVVPQTAGGRAEVEGAEDSPQSSSSVVVLGVMTVRPALPEVWGWRTPTE